MLKKISCLLAALAVSGAALATTFTPVQLLNPTGSTSGQAIVSTGASSAPAWGSVTLSGLAQQAANTVLANATASSASPTAFAMPSCSSSTSALQWTSGTGFTCFAGAAPIASPTFTGTVTIPAGASISGFATLASPTFTGTVTIPAGASISGFATLASPTFTGTPAAPTAAAGTSTTQIATTAFAATAATNAANTAVTNQEAVAGRPYFGVHLASAQSVTGGAATAVNFDTVDYDTGSYWNSTSHEYVPQVAGKYLVTANLYISTSLSATSENLAFLYIYKNGAAVAQANQTLFANNAGTFSPQINVAALVTMNGTTDYLQAYGDAPGASATFGAGANFTFLQAYYVGP